jgi:hypothetical protein
MTITAADIVTLRPQPEDIREAVSYAIKSGDAYTYNRMAKNVPLRVTRIARGKVNERLFQRFVQTLGIRTTLQEKDYRQPDDFDVTLDGKRGPVKVDVKTFHVLTQFIKPPRKRFSFDILLSGVDHTAPQWHLFCPMLVPQDYKQYKDVYVFALSVEERPDWSATSVLAHPWCAFPDAPAEEFLVTREAIEAREHRDGTLSIEMTWPRGIPGKGCAVHECVRDCERRALQKVLPLEKDGIKWEGSTSFLAIQVDDRARHYLRQNNEAAMTLSAADGDKLSVTSEFPAGRFHEVFPRQDFALYLIGWIKREDFTRIARKVARGTGCYPYPPRQAGDTHAPGTKTGNWYVLPGVLHPIAELTQV